MPWSVADRVYDRSLQRLRPCGEGRLLECAADVESAHICRARSAGVCPAHPSVARAVTSAPGRQRFRLNGAAGGRLWVFRRAAALNFVASAVAGHLGAGWNQVRSDRPRAGVGVGVVGVRDPGIWQWGSRQGSGFLGRDPRRHSAVCGDAVIRPRRRGRLGGPVPARGYGEREDGDVVAQCGHR